MDEDTKARPEDPESGVDGQRVPRDVRRALQLTLGRHFQLLDGLLQLQPFMFTAGARGFSGMLAHTAAGNPGTVARTITWNAAVVGHHAELTNAAFALFQILLGLGIAWRPMVRYALGASAVGPRGVVVR